MALERDPAHPGDIGDNEPEEEPDPDRIYEQAIERRIEEVSED
ncbi:hypothetical protein GCM10008995_01520 [Halobellus salinus]|uniref:Uncharacterized protein n=1 Tax=Halobellus salinus TaxID=931585 RepID=A0A830EBC8_9EURY|nr:hypothetical protein [Halobellus salinus]GGI95009.1 hypothetical protein GCM10008995_01520 [Halobellus salinus]SMP20476.1 hypothetical protein SAMN06265347_107158 [Halobellus salinus]